MSGGKNLGIYFFKFVYFFPSFLLRCQRVNFKSKQCSCTHSTIYVHSAMFMSPEYLQTLSWLAGNACNGRCRRSLYSKDTRVFTEFLCYWWITDSALTHSYPHFLAVPKRTSTFHPSTPPSAHYTVLNAFTGTVKLRAPPYWAVVGF
jgi:hypothetical protein